MKNCPKCQASVSDTAKFCVKCGFNMKKHEQEVQKEYFCGECGTKFSGGTFCPECGYDVSKDLNTNESSDNLSVYSLGDALDSTGFDLSSLFGNAGANTSSISNRLPYRSR